MLQDLLLIINKFCLDATLNRYDYAIDVPCKLSDAVFNTRKEKGLYKGTRCFGQRNKMDFVGFMTNLLNPVLILH